ncbi:hypothetical protein BaRGS_00029998 [Batillaria attramentaria]|uniref:Seryl-tRNA synthetase n=1 Tax=Batillaria attramentaria TaxID=370345 RepID=A0ABD0JVW6_9CAEN
MASGARKSSSLFVSGGSENMAPAPVQVDLDLGTRLSGENVLQLRQNLSARQMNFDLDQLLEDYKTFRDVDQAKVSLEKERVEIADQMSTLIKDKSKTSEEVSEEKASLTKRGKHVREQFKVISQARWEAEEKVMLRALNLPADLHTDTPEDGDRVLDSTEGTVTSPVYLLGELAELEMCLIQRVTAVMHGHDLLQIASPEIFRSVVAEGCGFDPANCEQVTMFAACSNADEATDICRGFTRLAWDVTRELGLPSRLVTVSPPSLLPSESLRTEVQVWAPSLHRYLPVGRVSQHGDYVSRRLMCRQHPGGDFVHMVSGLAMDVTTILVALLEHSYPQVHRHSVLLDNS